MKYLLFDLDGTLTDPGEGITNAVRYALERFGLRVEQREELYPYIGPPLTDSFQRYHGLTRSRRSRHWPGIGNIMRIPAFTRTSPIPVLRPFWPDCSRRATPCWSPPPSRRSLLRASCSTTDWNGILPL